MFYLEMLISRMSLETLSADQLFMREKSSCFLLKAKKKKKSNM